MSTKMIIPKNAYYIKLGRNGVWEKDCLEVSQTLKLGYREISHELCLQGRWDEVQQELLEKRDTVGAATKDKNQIRAFYESDEQVLWVTFFGDRLYWCFSNSEIILLSDKNKSRSVIGQWSSSDLAGKPLQKSQLSGALLRMQGFRRSICQVKELKYLVEKINGVVHPEIESALQVKADFERKIETLIRKLTWKDFELLVDLLFRQAGWQRMATLGKTEKTIDLDLYSPITDERFLVQVKSSANLSKLQNFRKGIGDFQDYDRAYFLVHTPSNDLIQSKIEDDVEVWLPSDIARRIVMYGLAEWVINKVS
jgi:hypothetical protein